MQRKDDHIRYALNQPFQLNDFDRVRFIPISLPSVNVEQVDLSIEWFNQTLPYPIYINAMTGGTTKAQEINEKLAKIANHFNFPLASGSLSVAIKHPETQPTFEVLRAFHKEGFVMANIGVSAPVPFALKAVDILKANALQIHLNAPQEIIMPEGDRDFSYWKTHLKAMIDAVNVPVIVKEVGFGMSVETLEILKDCGVKTVDVSGKGGTNFIQIENLRRDDPLQTFEQYGFSTVESLLEAKKVEGLTILASGGIRQAFDIVKALALGAKAVGMSGYFLKLVHDKTLEEAIATIENLIEDIKKIMAVLDVSNLHDLRNKPLLFDETLLHFIKQRNIPIKSYK